MLAGSGVAGLVLGLASQETLANLFAGLALQIDRPYKYGDCIRLPTGEVAIVRKIGMRSTKLEELGKGVVVVSNSEFAKMRITNYSAGDGAKGYSVSADVPLETDFAALEKSIAARLAREKPGGLASENGFSGIVSDIRCSQTVRIAKFTFYFSARDFMDSLGISKAVNDEIAGFLRRKYGRRE